MTWHPAPLPDVRIVGFRMVEREALAAVASIKIGEHIRLNNVRLLRMDDGVYTVATATRPEDSAGPRHDIYLSPELRSAVAELLLTRYRKRAAEIAVANACIPAPIGA